MSEPLRAYLDSLYSHRTGCRRCSERVDQRKPRNRDRDRRGRGGTNTRLPPLTTPVGPQRVYTGRLRSIAAALTKLTKEVLDANSEALKEIATENRTNAALASTNLRVIRDVERQRALIDRIVADIGIRFVGVFDQTTITGWVMDAEEDTEGRNQARFRTVVRRAVKITGLAAGVSELLLTKDEGIGEKQRTRWIRQNLNLINTIPSDHVKDVEKVIRDFVRKGTRVEALQREIVERGQVSAFKAERIARDQTNKLNGQASRKRQRDLNITHYKWRTVNDGRVREEHEDREDDLFAWAKPPFDGHPGQPIMCRCWPEPDIRGAIERARKQRRKALAA